MPFDEPLHEVRRRVFTAACGELERLEDFINLGPEKVEPEVACPKIVVKVDQFDAVETHSEVSTQVPCSSNGDGAKSLDDAEINSVACRQYLQVPCSSVGTRARFQSDLSDNSVRVPLSLDNFLNGGLTAYPATPAPAEDDTEKTTLMFRNLPVWFTRQKLEALLSSEGFGELYDFIYLPAELGTGTCFGYAFINMATAQDAERFVEHFQGFDRWPEQDDRRAVVHLSEALQGLQEQIERYRNSPLMHPSVADDLRPAVYSRGLRVEFPAPTVPIRAPRVRTSTKKKGPMRAASKSDL